MVREDGITTGTVRIGVVNEREKDKMRKEEEEEAEEKDGEKEEEESIISSSRKRVCTIAKLSRNHGNATIIVATQNTPGMLLTFY